MRSKVKKRRNNSLLFCVLVLLAIGLAQFRYYLEAVEGHLLLLWRAKPIAEWLADPAVDADLKSRLKKVQEIRTFASLELGLPMNDSFTRYVEVRQPFVAWNVIATPELSLRPLQWCFPVVGCVSYRGYHDEAQARAFAAKLRSEGYDVYVAGVPAYSTVGWLTDPVLSTFIYYQEAGLARMIFHELAHQVVYAEGDTEFSESFAVAVEEAGIDLWLKERGNAQMRAKYARDRERNNAFMALLLRYRDRLAKLYSQGASDDEKRQRKAQLFQALSADYARLKSGWGNFSGYDHWFATPVNNALLASLGAYHDFVPGFHRLLSNERSFAKFYEAVRGLAALDASERRRKLMLLEKSDPAHPVRLKGVNFNYEKGQPWGQALVR